MNQADIKLIQKLLKNSESFRAIIENDVWFMYDLKKQKRMFRLCDTDLSPFEVVKMINPSYKAEVTEKMGVLILDAGYLRSSRLNQAEFESLKSSLKLSQRIRSKYFYDLI